MYKYAKQKASKEISALIKPLRLHRCPEIYYTNYVLLELLSYLHHCKYYYTDDVIEIKNVPKFTKSVLKFKKSETLKLINNYTDLRIDTIDTNNFYYYVSKSHKYVYIDTDNNYCIMYGNYDVTNLSELEEHIDLLEEWMLDLNFLVPIKVYTLYSTTIDDTDLVEYFGKEVYNVSEDNYHSVLEGNIIVIIRIPPRNKLLISEYAILQNYLPIDLCRIVDKLAIG